MNYTPLGLLVRIDHLTLQCPFIVQLVLQQFLPTVEWALSKSIIPQPILLALATFTNEASPELELRILAFGKT